MTSFPATAPAAPSAAGGGGAAPRRGRPGVLARARRSWWVYLFLLPTFVGYGLWTVYPLLASWWYAFLDWPGFALRGEFVGLENFERLLGDDLFWNAFGNSLVFMVVAVPIRVGGALLLALVLNSRLTPLRGLFRTLIFLPVVTTGAVIGVVFTLILDAGGPVNAALLRVALLESPVGFAADSDTSLGAVIGVWVWKWLGITMIYWLAALQTIPPELGEAARVDRAGPVREFLHITLPLLVPFLVIITLIDMVGALNVFDLANTLTGGGPAYSSEVIEIFIYRTAFEATVPELGYASAAAVLFGLLTIALAVGQALGVRAVRRRSLT
ncbi:carbohydrate ABC transporter permease [Auraticoccus monumenti]|uniref:Multiple sugar transport system permease protein n=1 Tax=Auraticoccus monumenti TaxID=675864 RepID=A0A1G6ZCS9_9ACTN|nr:sugar ABC transporter permease [Auraticoccus monumenti]SDD99536.1 multiple sugar transport system permease protein [Auraticoccus monumenti]